MKCRKLIFSLMLGFSVFTLASSVGDYDNNFVYIAEATELEDNLQGNNADGNSTSSGNGVADFLKGYEAMTDEQLQEADAVLSPLTNLIGNVIGGVVVLICAGMFLVTAADLLYISVPFTRSLLYRGGGQRSSGNMMGGYGRMGYGNMSMGSQNQSSGWQIISDEAVQCSALIGNGGHQQQMMGGFGAMQQQQSNMSTKSVIFTYFKKRVIFLILLAVCLITLLSSVFLGTGINLALWLSKLIATFNTYIPI